MNWRQYLLLTFLGLLTTSIVAIFQHAPGYMDADYYYAGGVQLVNGQGFTEPYLWNFLDDPAGLPHPSHAYWMPLASLLVAAGALVSGHDSWWTARIGFLIVAACLPALTAALACRFTTRRDLALTSGLLAVFPGYYLIYMPTTDTFGIYMLLGGIFILLLTRKMTPASSFLIGAITGLLHLARADGVMWLLIACLAIGFQGQPNRTPLRKTISYLGLCLAGYLLLMLPWFLRNLTAFGSVLAPGGAKMLWLTSYDQIFSFPASQITFFSWWQSGLMAILKARVWALGLNLANAFSVQGGIFLWPLGVMGLWQLRRDRSVQLVLAAWLVTLAAMTVVFPFAGARGGFLHSEAALQIAWWALIPIGLDKLIEWCVRKRDWNPDRARCIFPVMLVILTALLTGIVTAGRLGAGAGEAWGNEQEMYSRVNEFLALQDLSDDDVVIVANPPGFWLASGHPAIALPDGDAQTVLALARRYRGQVLILEPGSIPSGLIEVYERPEDFPGLFHLGDVEGRRVFSIQP